MAMSSSPRGPLRPTVPVSTRFDATYPADPLGVGTVRKDVVEIARACGFGRARLGDIKLAVSEAATNAVVHAYRDTGAGEIRARVLLSDAELVVVIADDGPGMLPRTDSPGMGLGVPMMTTVSDRVQVVSEGNGCEVHLTFLRPR